MFCKYCGKRQPDDAEVCSYCGNPLAEEEKAESPKRMSLEEKLSRLEIELAKMGEQLSDEEEAGSILPPEESLDEDVPVMEEKRIPVRDRVVDYSKIDNELPDLESIYDFQDEPAPEPVKRSAPVKKERNTKKMWVILGACGAIAIIVICMTIWMMTSIFSVPNKVMDAVKAGDWTQATEIYASIKSPEDLNEISYRLNEYVETLMDSYRSGTLSASDVIDNLTSIQSFNIAYLSDKLAKYITELNNQTDSDALYKKAEDAYNNGNYSDAITYFGQFEKSSSHYEKAQEMLEKSKQKFKEEYFSQAESLADKKDYEGAIDKLNDALKILKEDSEITSKITDYTDSYVKDIISQADALAKKEDYDGADKILAQAISLFPDEKTLYSKRSEIAAMKSIELVNVCAPYAGRGCTVYKTGSSFKMGTNSYTGFILNNTGIIDDEVYAEINLEKKYTNLSMSIGRTDKSAQGEMKVYIYADNKQVRQYEIDDDSIKTATLSVEGVEKLRIVIISDTDGVECGFGNAKLKK